MAKKNFSLRAVKADGTDLCILPHHKNLAISLVRSDAGSISFDYPLNGKNAAQIAKGSEIRVLQGGTELRGCRFWIDDEGEDQAAEEGKGTPTTWTGRTWGDAMLDKARVFPAAMGTNPTYAATTGDDPGPAFAASTPGYAMKWLIDQAQARGCFPSLTYGFTNTVDSVGNPWPTVFTKQYGVGIRYGEVLKDLVDLGLVEYEFVGRELRMYLQGYSGTMERDLTQGVAHPVVLRKGRDLAAAPVTGTSRDVISAVLMQGEGGIYSQAVAGASDATFRVEGFFSESGVEDLGTLQWIGAQRLAMNAYNMAEQTYSLGSVENPKTPLPWADFYVGDWVLGKTGNVAQPLRVAQITVNVDESGLKTGSVVLGDLLDDKAVKLQRRIDKVEQGIVASASAGGAINHLDATTPKPPTGLILTTASYQDAKGTTYGIVFISWTQVTQNTDNTPYIDGGGYRLQWKKHADTGWGPDWTTTPDAFQTSISGLPLGINVDVRVRAYDLSGHLSTWVQASIVVSADTVPPNQPSNPTVDTVTFGGVARITWDGKDYAGNAMPPDFAYLEVHTDTVTPVVPSDGNQKDMLLAAGTSVFAGSMGLLRYAAFVAVDRSGNKSTVSASVPFTIRRLVDTDLIDQAITAAKIATDAVTADKLSAGVFGTDLVLNGGFEDPIGDGDNHLTGNDANFTTTLGSWTGFGSATLTRIAVGDMQMRSGAAGDMISYINAFYQVYPNLVYTAIGTSQASVTPRDTRIYINFYDAAHAYISQASGNAVTNKVGSGTQVSATGVAPANAAYAIVFIYVLAVGAANEDHHWSLFSLHTGNSLVWRAPADDVGVPGQPKWVAAGWRTRTAASRVAVAAYSGAWGILSPASGATGIESDLFPVSPGDILAFSAMVKTDIATANGLYLRVSWRDAGGAEIGISDPVQNAATTMAFVEYSGQTIAVPGAPAGTVYARAQIYSLVGAASVDAVSVRKVFASAAIKDQAIINAKIADLAVSTAKIADLAVVTAKIGDLAVVNAKIGTLAVNDANIASVNVGKLTAGYLSADVTVSARVKTADTGARTELNSTGLHVFDSGNAEVATLAIVGGVPSLQILNGTIIGGTYKSAASGARIEISSSAGYDTIAFFTAGGASNVVGNRGGSVLAFLAASGALMQLGTISPGVEGLQILHALTVGTTTSFGGAVNVNGNTMDFGGGHINACTALNNGGGAVSMNGVLTTTGAGDVTSQQSFTGLAIPTTATAANATIGAGGRINKFTSSKRYKRDIKRLTSDEASTVLDLRPVTYRDRQEVRRDKNALRHYGFVAEEAHDQGFTSLVTYDEEDRPDGFQHIKLISPLLLLVKDLHERVALLEKELVR